jgi:hypothetical protein
MDLRAIAERDLANPFRDWGQDVVLIDPDGVSYSVRGQVFDDSMRVNPDTGDEVIVSEPRVKLRRSQLDRVPAAGETWLVKAALDPGGEAETFSVDSTRPPETGRSIGVVILFLQRAVQS